MVSLVVLIPCVQVLIGTAIAVSVPSALSSMTNPGPHGLSQALYAYSSMGNNNGSAFAGFGANVPLHNILGGIVMFASRFFLIVPILALAGSLAQKNVVPESSGTLQTDTPLFVALLCGSVLIVGALTFVPALALGPIAEYIQLLQKH
jgi:K+-transporting ATPase ATPase A chain